MTTNPDRACDHEDFEATVEVNRHVDDPPVVKAYIADLRISCAVCGEPFRFNGVQAGLSPAKPMVSVNEQELHIPIRPASADPDFGLSGVPGFAVRFRDA
jgi:hypothetical protein